MNFKEWLKSQNTYTWVDEYDSAKAAWNAAIDEAVKTAIKVTNLRNGEHYGACTVIAKAIEALKDQRIKGGE